MCIVTFFAGFITAIICLAISGRKRTEKPKDAKIYEEQDY